MTDLPDHRGDRLADRIGKLAEKRAGSRRDAHGGGRTAPGPAIHAPRGYTVALSSVLMTMVIVGALRNPGELPLFIRILAPLAGLAFLAATAAVSRMFFLPYMVVAIGFVGTLKAGPDPVTLIKLAQVFLMVCMAHLVSTLDPATMARRIVSILMPLAIIVIPLEMAFGTPSATRDLFGVSLLRFDGLAGHHNYSAALYCFLGIILLYHRRYLAALFFFAVILTTASRGFAAAALLALAVALVPGRLFKTGAALAIVLIAASFPLWLWELDKLLTPQTKVMLNVLTSLRYDHWITHINMGLQNPWFGVGYLNSVEVYDQYHIGSMKRLLREQEAHNLFISLFAEWGVVAWLLFSAFFVRLTLWVGARNSMDLPILVYIAVIFSFYNGITEWVMWFGAGYLLARWREAGRKSGAPPEAAPDTDADTDADIDSGAGPATDPDADPGPRGPDRPGGFATRSPAGLPTKPGPDAVAAARALAGREAAPPPSRRGRQGRFVP